MRLPLLDSLAGAGRAGVVHPCQYDQKQRQYPCKADCHAPARVELPHVLIFLRSEIDIQAHYPSKAPTIPAMVEGETVSPLRFCSATSSGARSSTCAPVC